MRSSLVLITLVAAGLAVSACQRDTDSSGGAPKVSTPTPATVPTPPPAPTIATPTGFHHEEGLNATGYYLPATTIRVANFQLSNITLGSGSDFTEWENGRRSSEFGPVMVQFDDVSSPMRAGETGGQSHTVNVRVLPTAYNVDSHTLSFAGTATGVGAVVLQARFDQEALHHAVGSSETTQTPVARGSMTIGGRRFENVAFSYFAGD